MASPAFELFLDRHKLCCLRADVSYFLCSTRKRVRATKEIAMRRLHEDNSYDDDNLAVVQVKIIN